MLGSTEHLRKKLLMYLRKGGILPDTFYKANITLLPKHKKENYKPISLTNIDAKLSKTLAN